MWRSSLLAVALSVSVSQAADLPQVQLDMDAMVEAAPYVFEAARIFYKVSVREAQHKAELGKRGVAELPPSQAALRYRFDPSGVAGMFFDSWGELWIDRRFLTADELAGVRRIENFVRRRFPGLLSANVKPRKIAGKAGLPVFRGFEDARYQQHDELIARVVKEFNANKADWCGGTRAQAAKISDLPAALVKSQMIQESGGSGMRSRAAWEVDPLQVNVPGDWGEEKTLVGLVRPTRRNEGEVEGNVRAAIKYLVRKGFGVSARPARERPLGIFDGWKKAVERYNGRRDRTDSDRYYSEAYAEEIVRRASDPDLFVPIGIKLK